MRSLDLQYVSGFVDDKADTKKGKTATVSLVTIKERQYAFKKYRQNAVEDIAAMEDHICSLFDCLGESKYNEMMLFGAFPKYLVYNQNSFCGFLMDIIPRECYSKDQKDRHLGSFYGIQGEINKFSDQQIGQYVKNLGNLIYDLHESGFILGDALNDQNLYVRVIDDQLYPYLVDTDSLRRDQANPAKTYHSPNFEPPEGADSPSSKASDIYKYCLIVLRLFAKPEKEYERAGLRIEDSASAGSLQRIQETLGDRYKDIVVKGLQDNPSQRPKIRAVVQSFTSKKETLPKKQQKIFPNDPCPCGSGKKYKNCHGRKEESTTNAASSINSKFAEVYDILAGQMHSGDDYSVSEPINEKNIYITLNGIKRIESFFKIDNFNDPANGQIEKGIREAICRKERKLKESDKGAAAKVKALIDAIGKVTYTEECRKRISTARMAFSNLTVPQRMLVPTDKLIKAEAEYEKLKKAAEDGNKKKRTVGIVAAAIVAIIIGGFAINNILSSNQSNNSNSSVSTVESGSAEEAYIKGNIETLNAGMTQGEYKQVIFGKKAVYCLNNDGSIKTFAIDQELGEELETVYSAWDDITSITIIPNTAWYNESLIGIKNDGTVLAPEGSRVYQGEIDVSEWENIVQIDASNAETVLGVSSDGSVLCSPSTRNYDGSQIFTHGLDELNGCVKVVSVETKDVEVLGLSSAGTVVPTSAEYAPYTYYHGDWGNSFLSWSGLKDISICSLSTDLFGLTQDGSLVYGGVFGYSGTEYFDEDSIGTWTDIMAISTGGSHLVALKENGTVLASGNNNYGQCDVGEWKNIARVEAYSSTTVGYGEDRQIYFTGYNCLEKALSDLQSESETETSTVAVRPIHYYHLDIEQSDENNYNGSFGPNYWSDVSNLDSEAQLYEVSKEFFTRINADPVMAVACLAYVDKEMGTRYTGEFYSSISDNWVSELNSIADGFIEDNGLWNDEVQAFTKLLNSASVSIDEVSGGNVKSFLMNEGENHPVLLSGSYSWPSESTCHYLTYGVSVKGTDIRFSFLIESGFVPVIEDNS